MMPFVRRDKQKQAQKQNHDEEDRGEDQQQCPSAARASEMFCFSLHSVCTERRSEETRDRAGPGSNLGRFGSKSRIKSTKFDDDFEGVLLIINRLMAIFCQFEPKITHL
jgi:hypothetical protein